MSVYVLNQNFDSEELSRLVDVCKSSSMSTGKKLRQAHYQLGQLIATEIIQRAVSRDYAVLIMMRAGLFYGQGIADKIEEYGSSVPLVLIGDNKITEDELSLIKGEEILVVDAVINTGKSIFEVLAQLPVEKITLASTVIPDKSLHQFEDVRLYTVRTSKNKYTGAKVMRIADGKGPDTGDRLFNTM